MLLQHFVKDFRPVVGFAMLRDDSVLECWEIIQWVNVSAVLALIVVVSFEV